MNLVFIVWDTLKRKAWVSPRGRITWAEAGNARKAWETHTKKMLVNQYRFQIHEAQIVRGDLVNQ